MRVFRSLLLVVVLVGLGGCHAPPTSPRALPSTSSVLTSEDEALAAATDTYERFLSLSNQILNDGGTNPERIDAIAAPAISDVERAGYADIAVTGHRYLGQAKLSSAALQSWSRVPDRLGVVAVIHACVDLSETDVVDSTGSSIVAPERAPLSAWEIGISPNTKDDPPFLIAVKNRIESSSRCE
ncbi:hypothetical protein [Plantibacter sp. YIM 135249]|uniref:hypothetical protein n=1 Tax=Plantibacter sp. YIM 135249 TaxID=3423918 RepID=UPI003D352722